MEIIARGGQIHRIAQGRYQVHSQKTNDWYTVEWQNGKWSCECEDHKKTQAACKHIHAIGFLNRLPHILMTNLNYELLTCPKCNSDPNETVSIGQRRTKSGSTRRYRCKRCGYKFSDRFGFSKMRNDPLMIIAALDLYFKNVSIREIQHHLSTVYGCEVSHMSVYRWITKYVKLVSKYTSKMTPHVGGEWHVDEMVVKLKGEKGYLWNVLDRKTRFLLVSEITTGRSTDEAYRILEKAVQYSGKKSDCIVSDGLKSYPNAAKRLGIRRHISSPKFTDPSNNNLIESLHGTLRPRYDLTKGLDSLESGNVFAQGSMLYHNFVRPHTSLGGLSPSDRVGFKVEGRNRWLALARNATSKQT
jgi:transposase-like protein